MIINSSEYFNALKDYKIKLIRGYYFDKTDIFSGFVDELYALRLSYPKGTAMNFTCKLFMNSLFGRFAMNPILTSQKFINKDDLVNYQIKDFIDLEDEGYFITYNDISRTTKFDNSISISRAVTAYSRVFRSNFKNRKDFNLYYSDTDSIFIDKELAVRNNLGEFKLEYTLKEGLFLGPKVYGGITDSERYLCKVKGYKDSKLIPFEGLKSLLIKISILELKQNKWFR